MEDEVQRSFRGRSKPSRRDRVHAAMPTRKCCAHGRDESVAVAGGGSSGTERCRMGELRYRLAGERWCRKRPRSEALKAPVR